jgi:hypothetical protein
LPFVRGARKVRGLYGFMRVLLVYANRARILLPAPPIGLSYVAAATQAAGHQVHFLDLMASCRPEAALQQAVHRFQPEVVGFSVRNVDTLVCQRPEPQIDATARLVQLVRATSRATVVVGGPAVSVLGGPLALRCLGADFAVVGPGEQAFPALLSALERGEDPMGVAGIFHPNGTAELGRGPESPAPVLPWGPSGMQRWVNWKRYERGGGTWPIHAKRGCDLHCVYCNYPCVEGAEVLCRPPGEIVDEIESVVREVGPRTFEFTDAGFNNPTEHALAVCEEILRRRVRAQFTVGAIHPRHVSPELIHLMKRAGFNSMVVTADSAHDGQLARLGKSFSAADVERTAALTGASGMAAIWFFILGGPGETLESIDQTLGFIERHLNRPRSLAVVMTGLRVLPGTTLARQVARDGLLAEGADFARPIPYLAPGLRETEVLGRVNRLISRCPNVVHGAEENGSMLQRLVFQALHAAGAAPPYWRFLDRLLRHGPLRWLRASRTGVGAGA